MAPGCLQQASLYFRRPFQPRGKDWMKEPLQVGSVNPSSKPCLPQLGQGWISAAADAAQGPTDAFLILTTF